LNLIRGHSVRILATAITAFVLALFLWVQTAQADISRFVGEYSGTATMTSVDGSSETRDMSVAITETKDGFHVAWQSVSHKAGGRKKTKSYEVDFMPSDRPGIYAAAMQRNGFGHAVQLDPMKGEPYVWGRITGDTLTVFSLFLDETGGYELQQFDRTLAEGGLELEYSVVRNGTPQRSIRSFLQRN